MRWRTAIHKSIDAQAIWVVNWLHSRSAFIWLVYGSILWVPLVVLGYDKHGFVFLYIATTLSLATQVPLAMLAYWAHRDARLTETKTQTALEAINATQKGLLAVMQALKHEIHAQEEVLDIALTAEENESRA